MCWGHLRIYFHNRSNCWQRTAVLKCLDINPQNCRQYALTFTWEACTDQFLNNLAFSALPYGVGGQLVEHAA
jgi:hypothetical protein